MMQTSDSGRVPRMEVSFAICQKLDASDAGLGRKAALSRVASRRTQIQLGALARMCLSYNFEPCQLRIWWFGLQVDSF